MAYNLWLWINHWFLEHLTILPCECMQLGSFQLCGQKISHLHTFARLNIYLLSAVSRNTFAMCFYAIESELCLIKMKTKKIPLMTSPNNRDFAILHGNDVYCSLGFIRWLQLLNENFWAMGSQWISFIYIYIFASWFIGTFNRSYDMNECCGFKCVSVFKLKLNARSS